MTPLYGTYSGLVVTAQDPQNRGRVRLRIPQIMGTAVSGWAEPASVGTALPGDQVYVAFDGGDRSHPIYWPRLRTAVPGLWTPLALEPGWTASSAGSPVYRVTQDGMVELSGSVETSTAIGLGVTVKFASLPQGAWPIEAHRATTATVYRSAYNSKTVLGEYRATTTTTSLAYVTDPNGPSFTFVAPASGQVIITWGALMQNSTAASRCLMSCRVSLGGTTVAVEEDNRSAETQSTNNASTSNARSVTGLTPGTTYTVTAYYRTTDASTTATFDNKWMVVIPVGQHDTPAARITLTTSGDVQGLFPAGAASPYDMSLTGVRARII
ncbi:phage baseplate assembly protein V [Streptomyces griseoviridis]|uniref:phage baseplate assembly protein V n=1 Tax=Streptomyces griseoviridis TaxID=45398 RepID=UPI00344CB3C8